ncbi:MAG: NADH-quinone oxidoreductase subunit N [Chitinophagaceae bacterium]
MNTLILLVISGVLMMLSSMSRATASRAKDIALCLMTIIVIGSFVEMYYHYQLININVHLKWLQWNSFNLLILFFLSVATWFYIALGGKAIAEKTGKYPCEYFALLFFAFCGANLLLTYHSYLTLFLGIEILSLPQFILAASNKKDIRSGEAALKYFLMGSVASAILLMGIALIYGATGTITIQYSFTEPYLFYIGVLLVMVGFLFKVSIVPFHFWAPDVYEGSPTAFVGYMSGVLKVAVFLGFFRFFENIQIYKIHVGQINVVNYMHYIIGVLIVLSLIISNFTALFQQNLKRLMAYSSIAQAGFMLFAIYGFDQQAKEGLYIYAIAYSFALIGIFGIINKMEEDSTISSFRGFSSKNPFLAFVLFICFASLIGIPATAGFVGKYYMLLTGIQNGCPIWVIVIAVICAVLSAYYYLRVIQTTYFKTPEPNVEVLIYKISLSEQVLYIVLILIIIVLGIFPTLPFSWFLYF